MKKNFLYLFTVLCTLSFFTACSDDDDPKDPNVLDVNAAYSGDKLDLKYGDSALLGKEITFDTKDGKTATITMKGLFNLSELLAQLMPKSTAAAPSMAPGVIPGEVTTTISNVPLILSGETYTFEGEYTGASGVKATYSGEVKKDKLTMAVKATMPTNDLVGTWTVAPIVPGESAGSANKSQPINFVWQSDAMLDLSAVGFGKLPVSSAATLLAGAFISPAVAGALQSITYQEDGNIVASYKKADASDWATSPINLAQYYIANGKMYVQLNIAQIMDLVASSKADNNPLAGLMTYLSAGIPLNYTVANGTAQITADKELLLPVLGLLSNETVAGMIIKAIPKEQQMLVQGMIAQLPEILATTTDINVTLNLVKQ
ncbi:DUF4925 domain-containing protein [Parabacteroides gordonii]|jgi:hypothetical protein|uniref:DUF4925 domain-containing protein n=1 Tax=Parabacteroides gordonii TaxID=574930 RepID=UPI00241EF7CE|nr:DUF4925 domain-containing protein [Parabacteroides gordonii]